MLKRISLATSAQNHCPQVSWEALRYRNLPGICKEVTTSRLLKCYGCKRGMMITILLLEVVTDGKLISGLAGKV